LCIAIIATASVSHAGTIVDLTVVGNSGTINAAIYEQIDPHSTGTGVINSFSQQSPKGSGTTSRAYNTTVDNVLDNAMTDNFNHSIALGDVSVVLRGNYFYREFFLDINESPGGGDKFLSLDEVQVFVGGTANNSVATFTGGILDHDGTLVYRMDQYDDNWVALDAALNSGSGSGDMFLLIPNSRFRGYSASDVVTLYSQFGLQGTNPSGFIGKFGSSGGFEEWALRDPPVFAHTPEPAAWQLLAINLLLFSSTRRKAGRQ
jgi:hypothetical protein